MSVLYRKLRGGVIHTGYYIVFLYTFSFYGSFVDLFPLGIFIERTKNFNLTALVHEFVFTLDR